MNFHLFNIYADGLFYGQVRALNPDAAVRKARALWCDADVTLFEASLAATGSAS